MKAKLKTTETVTIRMSRDEAWKLRRLLLAKVSFQRDFEFGKVARDTYKALVEVAELEDADRRIDEG